VPGCKNRLWVEAHHAQPRARGGRHTRSNLLLLCTRHHQLCHDRLLVIEAGTVPGEFRFRAAAGWTLGGRGEIERDAMLEEEWDARNGDEEAIMATGTDPEERGGGWVGRQPRRRWGELVFEPRVTYGAGESEMFQLEHLGMEEDAGRADRLFQLEQGERSVAAGFR
jgi:hypothetical protein